MPRSLNAYGLIGLTLLLAGAWIFYLLKEDVPTLYINEFMANNQACCPDTDGGKDEFDDWIEIYNPGKSPIDIGGMHLSQDKDNPIGYQIPKTDSKRTTIQPGGFLKLWADGNPDQGVLHLKFKLSQNGEYIGLYHEDARKIDGLTFQKQTENKSYGRTLDGDKTWMEFAIPTPGRPNK